MNVFQTINAIQGELARSGIAKDRDNTGQGYKFRGIDDVYNALSPLLAKHALVVIPRMLKRDVIERQGRNGGALFYVTVEAEFDFVSAEDGTTCTARTFGEAMDSGDKATNKAMSAAYKYAAFQTFAIPTEGNNDADATTHEVAHKHAWIDPLVAAALKANEAGDEDAAWAELETIAMNDEDNESKLYVSSLCGNKGEKGSTPGSRLRSMLKRRATEQRERDAAIAKMSRPVVSAAELAEQA